MNYLLIVLLLVVAKLDFGNTAAECDIKCPTRYSDTVCGFDIEHVIYKIFPSKCAMDGYMECYNVSYSTTPLEFCIKHHNKQWNGRRYYTESCPVFCPNYYRPVCGVNKYRDYVYKTFNNGCYMDMINCRGYDDIDSYVEVPLQFCQNHGMKNIHTEQIVMTGIQQFDY